MTAPREIVTVKRFGIPTLIYKDEMEKGESVYVEKKETPKKSAKKSK